MLSTPCSEIPRTVTIPRSSSGRASMSWGKESRDYLEAVLERPDVSS
jgi:hypothetical protein